MTELPGDLVPDVPRAAVDDEVLLATITDAVLAVSGVAALEPRLMLTGLGLLPASSSNGGIRLRRRSEATHVDVSIATDGTRDARHVTHDVQHRVAAVLSAGGYPGGSVDVSVLRITPAP